MQGSIPQNGGYMVAGYVVTALILALYAASLFRRAAAALAERSRAPEG